MKLEDDPVDRAWAVGHPHRCRRDTDGVRALGARCPHFGALWRKSVLSDGRIVCPWHHACYSAATGDLLEPPAQDGLARYPVRVEDGRVLVSVPDDAGSPHPDLAGPDPARDPRVFVIVGAGAAGSTVAWTLRAEGFRGRIVLVTSDDRMPYDRTFLSKELLMRQKRMPSPDQVGAGLDPLDLLRAAQSKPSG